MNSLQLRPAVFCLLLTCVHFYAYSQLFSEVSKSAGIDHLHVKPSYLGGGVACFDYDDDGNLDLLFTGGFEDDGLFRNNGDGTFTNVTLDAGLVGPSNQWNLGVVTGDIDNDGDRDVFLTSWGGHSNQLFLNNGNGTFSDATAASGVGSTDWSISAAMADYNLDGYLDIYAGNYIDGYGFLYDSLGQLTGFSHSCFQNHFYINNGDGTFTESAGAYGVDDTGCALAVSFTDFDLDHDQDLHISNDFGAFVVPDQLYQNEYPVNAFSNVSMATNINSAVYGMGIATGDYDRDGDFDYYISNLGRNVLHQNQGNGTFIDVTDSAGVTNTFADTLLATSWGNAFVDFNNDGSLDLFVSNGYIPSADFIGTNPQDPNKLYLNLGNGTFSDISTAAGLANDWIGRGMAYGDYDNDGDLDIGVAVISNTQDTTKHALLYRNDNNSGNQYIQVELQGVTVNRDAYGTKVYVYAGGELFISEVKGGSSHASQHSSILHFGLGGYSGVDSLRVFWPGGATQSLYNLATGQRITIVEDPSVQCNKVTGMQSTAVTSSAVLLVWNSQPGDQGFTIRGRAEYSSTYSYLTIPNGSITSKYISGLPSSTTFIWQIRRTCEPGRVARSQWSAVDTFTTLCSPVPTIWTNQITHLSATLNWLPAPGSSGYLLAGKPTSSFQVIYVPFNNSTTSFPVSGLTPNTSYIWAVANLCDESGKVTSEFSLIDTFMTLPVPIFESKTTSIDLEGVALFPNPNKGSFMFRLSRGKMVKAWGKVTLVDAKGLTVPIRVDRSPERLFIELIHPVPGLYQLQILNNSFMHSTSVQVID